MVKYKSVILLLILLSTGFSANITFELSSCLNNITLQTSEIIEVDNITNVTTMFTNTNCIHGCNNETDTCNDPNSDFSFLGLVIFGLIGSAGVIFLIAKGLITSPKEGEFISENVLITNDITRSILMLLSIIAVYSAIMVTVVYTQSLEGILGQYHSIMNTYSTVLFAVFLLLLVYNILLLLINITTGTVKNAEDGGPL